MDNKARNPIFIDVYVKKYLEFTYEKKNKKSRHFEVIDRKAYRAFLGAFRVIVVNTLCFITFFI